MIRIVLGLALALAATPLAVAQLFPEVRAIPSEGMLPTLLVGDRVTIDRGAYKDGKLPKRGDIVIFQHPHNPRIMIKRVVGLPGDTVEMRKGRLFLNNVEVPRTMVRRVTYQQSDSRSIAMATEYSEQLPGEAQSHRIHEFSDTYGLDETPVFKVPAGHLFLIGDNRDNSEDSRAPTGHRAMAAQFPEAWPYIGVNLNGRPEDDAIGFVPVNLLMGRATSVPFTMAGCKKAPGAECLKSNVGAPL